MFNNDLSYVTHLTSGQFLNFEVADRHCGDRDLLSGGRDLFPEQMLVVLIVSVLLFRFAYYLVILSFIRFIIVVFLLIHFERSLASIEFTSYLCN